MKYIAAEKPDAGHSGYQQQVKEANIKRVFDLVRFGRCKSRAELVRHTSLSATSVSVLVEELTARGLVNETGPTQTSLPGRRPISLRLNDGARQLAVFALSREGVRYALMDLDCRIVESRQAALDLEGLAGEEAAWAYVKAMQQLLKRRAKLYDPKKALMAGISLPGIYLKREGLFYNRTTLGVALPEGPFLEFQRQLGLPVYMLNATRAMAYAEKRCLDAADPDGPGAQSLLFVNLGRGISCAMISRGDIYGGPDNIAGQIGHCTVDFRGRPCHCGSLGCLTQYVNRDAILADAREAAGAAGLTPPESLEALARRCPDAPALKAAVDHSARLLAAGLYSALCVTAIRRIVLTGVECLGKPFLDAVRDALLERALLLGHGDLQLAYAQSGPDAQVVGLAQHYLDKVYSITG